MSEAAEILARHVSPDGELVFRVEREDGVISFGFEGLTWHLHPDTFEVNGRTPEQVALDVVGDLINDRMVVVIDRSDGQLEYGILETIELEPWVYGVEAPLEFRFWSGRQVARTELLEGTVDYKPLGESWVATIAAAPR